MSLMLRSASHRLTSARSSWPMLLVSAGVLTLAFLLGQRASPLWLGLIAAGIGGSIVLARPALIPPAVAAAALLSPIGIGTGTDVTLNVVSLLIPILAVVWMLKGMLRRDVRVRGRPRQPAAAALPGRQPALTADRTRHLGSTVPVGGNFLLVQFAQWAIFAFSALAFWLAANLITDQSGLWRLTAFCLLLIGSAAIVILMPGLARAHRTHPRRRLRRAPLWALLAGLGGGQLLFNRQLSPAWRIFLVAALLAALAFALAINREQISGWVTLAAALGALAWLRFPRLRWPVAIVIVALLALGVLFPTLYGFAGGDEEWTISGASRLVLIERVVSVTLRNPITGLGPAAYRPYTALEPLRYLGANWLAPQINSHNNYVDIFSHAGLLGLALFLWFMAEVARLAWQLRRRFESGFAAGYANGMLAVWVACMVSMLLADVFLPFVYNVGFPGFQASVLVWLFMGGLVALENTRSGDGLREPCGGVADQEILTHDRQPPAEGHRT